MARMTSQAVTTKFEEGIIIKLMHSHGHSSVETQMKTTVFVMWHLPCSQTSLPLSAKVVSSPVLTCLRLKLTRLRRRQMQHYDVCEQQLMKMNLH